jgi:hypothetical protein
LKVIEKIQHLKPSNSDEDWKITYTTPLYGAWDLLVECIFTKLEEMDKIISFFRNDEDLQQWIEATTTLIGLRPNFQP